MKRKLNVNIKKMYQVLAHRQEINVKYAERKNTPDKLRFIAL
jgi:hypothetical protein